jgi:DNA-binding GntR family transcriptional regulator
VSRSADVAYSELRRRILAGEMPAGAHLGEAELAGSLGVSRTPVREALQRLNADGLVDLLPHRGAQTISWTPAELANVFELRALLEPFGAARAASRRPGEAELATLATLCDQMEAAAAEADFSRVAELNTALHGRILAASGNSRLTDAVKAIVLVPVVIGTFARYDADALQRSMRHHRELVAALCAGDPAWAESVMRAHIRAAANFVLGQIRLEAADE